MSFEVLGRRCACVQQPRDFIIESEIPGILSLRFPLEGELRVRKIVTRSRARRTHKYPSWKMDRMIEGESGNELVASRLYDLDPSVVSYHEQAIAIHYLMDGEQHLHIPDFIVRRAEFIDIDEIKDKDDEGNEEVIERSRILTPLLARLGLRYRVRFVDKYRYKPTLGFSRSVLRYGRRELTIVEREAARRLFASALNVTWGDIRNGRLGKRSKNIAARLLLEGEILATGRTGPLQESTVLVRAETKRQFDVWAA